MNGPKSMAELRTSKICYMFEELYQDFSVPDYVGGPGRHGRAQC